MSLEAILAKIEQDAKEKAGSIIEEAEKERDEALHEVRSAIKDRHHADVEKIRARTSARAERMKNHAHKEMEKSLLSHRRRIVDRAISEAVREIAGADDYLKMISALLRGCDLKGEVEVITAASDRKRITADFLQKESVKGITFVLSGEHHNDHGGIIMRSGDVSLNATLSMIAELNHDDMVMELSKLLPLPDRAE